MSRIPAGLIPTVLIVLGLVATCAAGLVAVGLWLCLLLAGLSLFAVAVLRELAERHQP